MFLYQVCDNILLKQTADGQVGALEKTNSKTKTELMAGGDLRDKLLLPDGVWTERDTQEKSSL